MVTFRCGHLRNEYTGSNEYFVLRRGVLKIFQDKKGDPITTVNLTNSGEVNLLPDNVIELRVPTPYATEYILQAKDKQDAQEWYDAFQACMGEERRRMQKHVDRIKEGSSLYKYNYSNSKRMRRHFWVNDEGNEMRWAKAKTDDPEAFQKVELKECIGMIYGPMTTTFMRCENIEDASWCCFSLLFMGRTLDLASQGEFIDSWFMGLQYLLSKCGSASISCLSEATFVFRKVQHKLADIAHAQSVTMRVMLLRKLRAFAQDEEFMANLKVAKKLEKKTRSDKHEKGDDKEKKKKKEAKLVDGSSGGYPSASNGHTHTPVANGVDPAAYEKANDALREQEKRAKKAEAAAEKLERRVQELEQQLSTASSNKNSGSAEQGKALAAARADANKFSSQVDDLKIELESMKSELDSLKSKHAREIAALEESKANEKAELQGKMETLAKEFKKVQKQNDEARQKIADIQNSKAGLVNKLEKLKSVVARLLSEHTTLKQESRSEMQQFTGEFGTISKAVQKLGDSIGDVKQRNIELMEERKKLHNLVLELKGNIRVFARVRPMNHKEKADEPKGEVTITFKEDMHVSVYDDSQSRRKWFEFDRIFAMQSTQREVFVEVEPLATSVLDGYNVCIFAYGQTGSGKTHTMSGKSDDHGLIQRTLTKLFQIKDERATEYKINMVLYITEIYNESVRDLLWDEKKGSAKKLDIKTNPDGSNTVPGLTEVEVFSPEDVLRVMAEAQHNRSTACTEMNDQSSRSHLIVTVNSKMVALDSKAIYSGKMNLVDLAGSENVGKSGVSGQGMREAQNINKSLSALGDVIQALVGQQKGAHIPYRNSKLTMMLKDSLGGDSKTLMIVQCSPAQENVTETLSSLNFAARARNVELGKAKKNVKQGE